MNCGNRIILFGKQQMISDLTEVLSKIVFNQRRNFISNYRSTFFHYDDAFVILLYHLFL